MARLTIPDEPTSATFTPSSAQSAFAITFALFEKADLSVTVDGVELLQSDFSFTGTELDGGGYDGGTVTLNTATSGVVTISRNVTAVRNTNFAPAQSVPPRAIDAALNRLTAIAQDHDRRIAGAGTGGGGGSVPPEDQIPISQVTGLQGALDGKANLVLSNLQSVSSARSNLGATSLGASLFTSASAAAAQAALGLVIGTDIPAYNDPRFAANSLTLTPAVAAGNTAAANTTAIQNALDTAALSSGPVRVVLPAGSFNVNPLTIRGNNISLEGQGQFNRGTNLVFTNATGDCITIRGDDGVGDTFGSNIVGGQYNVLSGLYLTSSVRRTSGFYVKTQATFECLIERVRGDFGWNGLWVGPNSTETRVKDCSGRYMLGENPGILFRGSAGRGCFRLTIDNLRVDNPYPIGNYSTYKARTNSAAFTAGQMSLFNNGIWMCVTSGTTGSSAPSTVPGSGPTDWVSTNATDGSVQWRYVANGSSCWVDQDSYAYSLVIDKSALINGAYGYRMRDSANTGSSYPIWAFCWDVETDHPIVSGVALTGGEGFFANGSWFGSTLNGNGVLVDTTYRGEVFVGGGTRIYGNAQHGVLVQSGPNETIISGCFIGANSTSSTGTYHGIAIADGTSGFTISNNVSGLNAQNITNYQGRGVSVGNGCSGFNVFGNDLRGNVNSEGLAVGTSPSSYNAFANIGSTTSTITASAPNEILSGTGSPEGVVSAAPGTMYRQTDGANGYTLWYKRTAGTGSTGWATVAGSHTTAVLQPQAGILFPLGQGVSTNYAGLGRTLIQHQPLDNGVIIGDVNSRSPYVAITANLVPDTPSTLLLGTSTQRFLGGNLVNAMNVSSDERLKRDIAPIDPGAMLDAVEAVSFSWRKGDTQRHYGWIAQNVLAATEAAGLPDIVQEDETLSLDPTAMCAILWNEVRSLRRRIGDLEGVEVEALRQPSN